MSEDTNLHRIFKEAFILSDSIEMKILWRRMLECVLHALNRVIVGRTERELLELITIAQSRAAGTLVPTELSEKFTRIETDQAVGELNAYFARQKRLFDLDDKLDIQSFERECDVRLVMAATERIKEIVKAESEQEVEPPKV